MQSYRTKGYKIQYATWGRTGDRAVLFFHGFPGSHVQAEGMARHVSDQNLFLIAADRPGYGGTEGSGAYGAYLDALHELLLNLGVVRFDIVGISGGSPWAHLMASRFATSVRSLTIICGLGPFNHETQDFFTSFQRRGLLLRKIMPTRLAEMIVARALAKVKPEDTTKRFFSLLSQADQDSVVREPHREMILKSMKQARQQMGKGIANDAALYRRDWLRRDCDAQKLARIPTFYFHGLKDTILSPKMSEWMHKQHPNAHIRFFENEGHYSLPLTQADSILQAVHESHREKVS